MGYVDLRLFFCTAQRDRGGQMVADTVQLESQDHMPIRLADVVRVNALAVPLRAPVNYQVLQHELRLLLSYLPDQIGRPLSLRMAEFQSSSSHIRRFVTESFGLGMLTAAVESEFGWRPDVRSLDHFDVLPARLAGRYKAVGIRPDLLFRFSGEPRRLAGEARGRSGKRPKSSSPSAPQRRRLDEIIGWSARHDFHPVAMTWAYTGSSPVQVDLFVLDVSNSDTTAEPPPPDPNAGPGRQRRRPEPELPPEAIAARAEKVLRASADALYRTAPEPRATRPAFDRQVRGEWVAADLLGPSNTYLFLGVLDREATTEDLAGIRRRAGDRLRSERDRDPIQVEVMGRTMIAVAIGTTAPPPWSEIIERLQ